MQKLQKLDETFKNELVRNELKNYTFIKFDASNIEETEDVLIEYDVMGLPTLIVLKPKKLTSFLFLCSW